MREVFEKWFLAQFGEDKTAILEWSEKDGYIDRMINSMWIGFNAGIELSKRG